MNAHEHAVLERHFVEEVGLLFETSGVPRMCGRILGRLMLCEPPHQSSAELAVYLGASRGAISGATRQLIQMRLLERHPVPGSRSTYFVMTPGSWSRHMHAEFAKVQIYKDLMARGIKLLADAGRPSSRAAQLREIHDLFDFMEAEFPALIERWEASRRTS